MRIAELDFERPEGLAAHLPPELRGIARDEVRLLVSQAGEIKDAAFGELPRWLKPGDVLVVNRSATLPASLEGVWRGIPILWNLCTDYGKGTYLAEIRHSPGRPGPLDLAEGEMIEVAGTPIRHLRRYPGLSRLSFFHSEVNLRDLLLHQGQPIRYGYVTESLPIDCYQTLFSSVPGSCEMPSAARPFTPRVLHALAARGIAVRDIVLHCGVSSLELEDDPVESAVLYPEPFQVPALTAEGVNQALRQGRRVIAVGTTVVRALESAWNGCAVVPSQGFTRRYVHPGRRPNVVSGLLTGFHDPRTSHLALLRCFLGESELKESYRHAVAGRYLWHEFGDSHLILPSLV